MKTIIFVAPVYYEGEKYNRKSLTVEAFVHSPSFKIHGIAFKSEGRIEFISNLSKIIEGWQLQYGANLENAILVINDDIHFLYALKVHYGIIPETVYDLTFMCRKTYTSDIEPFEADFLEGIVEPDRLKISQLRSVMLQYVNGMSERFRKLLPVCNSAELDMMSHTRKLFLNDFIKIENSGLEEARENLNLEMYKVAAPHQPEDLSNDSNFIEIMNAALAKTGRRLPINDGKYILSKNYSEFHAFLNDLDLEVKSLAEARIFINSANILISRLNHLENTARLTGGVMPVYLEYHKAITGRFSGGNKFSFQNIPIPERMAFDKLSYAATILKSSMKAPSGHVFVSSDAAQIEARLLAWWAGQSDLLSAFEQGTDVYSEFASETFGEQVQKMTGDTPEAQYMNSLRQIGKQAILGLGYNMGVNGFLNSLKSKQELDSLLENGTITEEKCQKIVYGYRNKYHRISSSWYEMEQAAKEVIKNEIRGTKNRLRISSGQDSLNITLPSNRMMKYMGTHILEDGSLAYGDNINLYGGKIVQNIIQAIARDLLVDVIRAIESQGFPVICHIHDEIICCVKEDQKENCEKAMLEAWKQPLEWGQGIPMDAKTHSGINFNKLK